MVAPLTNKTWQERFDERFELEFDGCSECGGGNLIDKTQIRFPKGEYHQEWDLQTIKSFIKELLQDRDREILEWADNKEVMGIGGNFGEGYERGYKNALQDLKSYLTKEE